MQDAKPTPPSSMVSVLIEIFTEFGLLAAYAMMLTLTIVVVSGAAIAYTVFVIPGLLTPARGEGA